MVFDGFQRCKFFPILNHFVSEIDNVVMWHQKNMMRRDTIILKIY